MWWKRLHREKHNLWNFNCLLSILNLSLNQGTHNLQNSPKSFLTSASMSYAFVAKIWTGKKKHKKHAIRFGKYLSHKTNFFPHTQVQRKKQSLKYKYVASKIVALDEDGQNNVFQHSRASLLFILFGNTLLVAQRLRIINWLSLPP